MAIVLCTYNPEPGCLELALCSIKAQTLDHKLFEVVVVDNNSSPPLHEWQLADVLERPVALVRERQQGLIFARVAGIEATEAPLVVFVDDDNELSPTYLSVALAEAARLPNVGTFGGVVQGRFPGPLGTIKEALVGHLGVRASRADAVQGCPGNMDGLEPIGAGMVVRREVADRLVGFVAKHAEAEKLGRMGNLLMSADDTLINYLAVQSGYKCAYVPSLSLHHHILAHRLRYGYLARLVYGHGRSYSVLNSLLDIESPDDRLKSEPTLFLKRFLRRIRRYGAVEAVSGFLWDLGYRKG